MAKYQTNAESPYWSNIFGFGFLFLTSIIGAPLYAWYFGVHAVTICLSVLFFCISIFGTTMGLHRYFSHRTFKAKKSLEALLLFCGSTAIQGSALNWVCYHRYHHSHCDHPESDPYNVQQGFWWAHIGWMLFHTPNKATMLDNIPDLLNNKLLVFEHRHYLKVAIFLSIIFPGIICGLILGTVQGFFEGVLFAGILRVSLGHQSTALINSLCHYSGKQPYSSDDSSKDNLIAAILAGGEGYHNFHHKFQHDYRNGVKLWQWDPTKWLIWTCSKLGLAYGLRRAPDEKILIAELSQVNRRIEQLSLNFGAEPKVKSKVHEVCTQLSEELKAHIDQLQEAVENQVKFSKQKLKNCRADMRRAARYLNRLSSSVPS